MSTAAVMMVKDELDVIEHVIAHLTDHVDVIYVSDNASKDGTLAWLEDVGVHEYPVRLKHDPDPAYFQSIKTTAMAMRAFEDGHQWVVPCDADEVWYADGRPIKDFLDGLAPDIQIVAAELLHHFPTALDPPARDLVGVGDVPGAETIVDAFRLTPEPNPFKRIGYRKRAASNLGKVIEAGNHDATTRGTALRTSGLHVRHYSWRTVEQFVRKIRNGEAAYAATDLPETTGDHWRKFAGKPDKAIADHFWLWFYFNDPEADDSMMFDPVTPFLGGRS
jgi:GT2 family glycosyltransferase